MQGEELMCLKLGRQKGMERNSPPKMGEELGGKKKRWGERKKKKSQLQPEKLKLEEVNLPPKIMRACPDPGRGSSPVYNRPCWSSCTGSPDD